ncbi:MAG: ABC transporter permease, partial [Armatimonadota bacterium]
MSWQRIRHIIRKEFIQIRRDPRVLRIILVAPVFQLIVFGYAVTTDVKHVPTAVVDSDRTRQSRDLLSRFVNSGYFDVLCRLDSPREIEPLLASGVAQVAIWIPKGFGKDLAQRRSASLQIALDGSDSTTAGVVMGYAAGIVRRFSEDVLSDRIQRLGLRLTHIPDVEDRVRVWYNPDLKSVNYMVPGVLCMILLIVTMLLTSLAIVRER